MDVVEQPSASLPAEIEMNFFGCAEIIELRADAKLTLQIG
jgi:hypothetical protein